MGTCLSTSTTRSYRPSRQNTSQISVRPRLEFARLSSRYLIHRKGDIQDDYTIVSKLGKGTFGSVYLGLHKRTGIERAIKTLSKKNIENPEKMLEEVEILKDLVAYM